MKKYKRIYNTPEYRKRYTGIYGSWYAMKQRCKNPNNRSFKNYGARGITYDPKWETFAGFNEDMGSTYIQNMTLERIDVDGNYCKENCKWIPKSEQVHNTRKSIRIKYNNKVRTLIEWSEIVSVPYKVLRHRHYNGWSIDRMLNTPKLTTWSRRKKK